MYEYIYLVFFVLSKRYKLCHGVWIGAHEKTYLFQMTECESKHFWSILIFETLYLRLQMCGIGSGNT